MDIQLVHVRTAELADDLAHQPVLHGAELTFDTAGHIESGSSPLGEREIRIRELRSDRHDKNVARERAMPYDDAWTHFVAAQIRERNRQENDVMKRAVH